MDVNGTEIRVAATLGLAIHRQGENAEALLTRADLAMYEARDKDTDGWSLFADG
jgi:predicted signal transduction protein with EAL and GGDEF domain